jgi:PAS domain S-box-containing protein
VLQPEVELDPDPRSAGLARRVVQHLLETSAMPDLVDEAELLVSEVVTNAVLHAATPIRLRCKVQRGVLCVEVHDRSPVLPGRRDYDDDAMTGRGLAMVELLAADWGVAADESGKTVWFLLGTQSGAVQPLDNPDHAGQGMGPATFVVRLQQAPTELLRASVQHGDNLLRELALTSMEGTAQTVAPGWQASNVDLGPVLDAVAAASEVAEVTVDLPQGAGSAALERLSLLEAAERLACNGALLTGPGLPEVSRCREWLLHEIAAQEQGNDPTPWQLPAPLEPLREAADVPAHVRRAADAVRVATILADDANRIVHVNSSAADLLGWDADLLCGLRLLAIIPPAQREAHLAGFNRYLLTREPRLLDRPMQVPVLRADGTTIELIITIDALAVGDHRVIFRARFY